MSSGVFQEVKVIAKSKKPGIAGLEGNRLKVKVHSPREKGKANEELIEVLSEFLKIPKKNISIVKGEFAPIKLFFFQGIDEEYLRKRIQELSGELPLM